MRMRTLVNCVTLAVVVATSISCGDVVRSSQSPMMLVIDSLAGGEESSVLLTSDVLTRVTSPAPCTPLSPCFIVRNDAGAAAMSVVPKNPTVAPSTNNDVTIRRYRVAYRRADGHNTPGVDVPHPFDGAVTVTIPAGATATVGFELVRVTAKEESPLVELVVNPNVLHVIADVTFFGTDLVGNDVSATGSISINFANFGP